MLLEKVVNYIKDCIQAAAGMCEKLNLKAVLLLQLLTNMRQKLQGNHLAQLLLRKKAFSLKNVH